MTLEIFSRDVVPILQLIVSLAGVGGLVLLWYQIKSTHLWNKANSQHQLLSNLPTREDEAFVWNLLEPLAKDEWGSVTEESAKEIYSSIDSWVRVKAFLNCFEQLCAAINAKTIDENYAYSVHSARITDIYYKFKNYIHYIRTVSDDDEIYIEMQKVASRWHERYRATKETRENQLKELKASLENTKGTDRVVP